MKTRHHWLTGAATLIEIGIALSTVAIITRRQSFWFGAMGLGAVGIALFAVAYTELLRARPCERPECAKRRPENRRGRLY